MNGISEGASTAKLESVSFAYRYGMEELEMNIAISCPSYGDICSYSRMEAVIRVDAGNLSLPIYALSQTFVFFLPPITYQYSLLKYRPFSSSSATSKRGRIPFH